MTHAKARLWAISLALFLVAFFALGATGVRHFISDLSENNRYCYTEKDAEKHQFEKECKSLLYRTYEDPAAGLAAVLTAATIGLFVATYFLWRATRDLVRGADKTAERQLRAYIGVRDGTIKTFVVGKHITGTINIQNFGATPGFKQITEVQMGTCSIEEFVATQFVGKSDSQIEATHWPGAITNIRFNLPDPLTHNDVERMIRKEYVLSVIGRIDYVDAFGTNRYTKIKMFSFCVDGGFNFATDGNEAT